MAQRKALFSSLPGIMENDGAGLESPVMNPAPNQAGDVKYDPGPGYAAPSQGGGDELLDLLLKLSQRL